MPSVTSLLHLFGSPGLVAHSDLDERAIEALKEFNEDGALQVLVQFKESDLSHVQVSKRGNAFLTFKVDCRPFVCFCYC